MPRVIALVIIFVLVVGSGACRDDATGVPLEGTASTAVFLFDYRENTLKGGAVITTPVCPQCPAGELPLKAHHVPAGDFGSIAFTHAAAGDTVFAGTIVWMGLGARTHPPRLTPPGDFERLRCFVPQPEAYEPLPIGSPVPGDEFAKAFPALWSEVADFEIVHRLAASKGFAVGLYLYPPTLGTFDPAPARWVLFLHAHDDDSARGGC